MWFVVAFFALLGIVLGSLATWVWCADRYGKVIRDQQRQIYELTPNLAGGRRTPSAQDLRAAYERTYGQGPGGSVDASGTARKGEPN